MPIPKRIKTKRQSSWVLGASAKELSFQGTISVAVQNKKLKDPIPKTNNHHFLRLYSCH